MFYCFGGDAILCLIGYLASSEGYLHHPSRSLFFLQGVTLEHISSLCQTSYGGVQSTLVENRCSNPCGDLPHGAFAWKITLIDMAAGTGDWDVCLQSFQKEDKTAKVIGLHS